MLNRFNKATSPQASSSSSSNASNQRKKQKYDDNPVLFALGSWNSVDVAPKPPKPTRRQSNIPSPTNTSLSSIPEPNAATFYPPALTLSPEPGYALSLSSVSSRAESIRSAGKLLKVVYNDTSMVTVRPDHLEEIELAVREMFSIPQTMSVQVSADVPSFNNERVLVHRPVWRAIKKEISVVWVTTTSATPARRPISLEMPLTPVSTNDSEGRCLSGNGLAA